MAKEIQILNNGDALYDIRRKINENFELVQEEVEEVVVDPLVKFGVNEGNETNGVADLLDLTDNTLSFKVGGEYPNLVITSGDGVTTRIEEVNPLHLQNLEDGEYKILVNGEASQVSGAEFYSQLLEPQNINNGDVWFNGEGAKQYLTNAPSITDMQTGTTTNYKCMGNIGDLYIAAGGGQFFYISRDGGATWENKVLPANVSGFLSCAVKDGYFYFTTSTNSIRRTAAGEDPEVFHQFADTFSPQKIKVINDLFILTSSGSTLSTSSDAKTWNTITIGTEPIIDVFYIDNLYYIISRNGTIYTSEDLLTFTEKKKIASESYALCAELYKNKIVLGGISGSIYIYDIATNTFSGVYLGNGDSINDMAVRPNGAIVFIGKDMCRITYDLQNFSVLYSFKGYLEHIYKDFILGQAGIIFKINQTVQWFDYPWIPIGEVIINGGQATSVITYPYNANGLHEASSSTFGLLRVAAQPDLTDCSCNNAAITPANLYNIANYRLANTEYQIGDAVGCPYHHNLQLKCIIAGTTSNQLLDTAGNLQSGDQIQDGTVTWQIEELGTGGAGGGGLEIGDIGIATLGIDETQNKRRYINGQLIIQEQFVSFTKKLKKAVELYPSLACTEEEWQATVTMSTFGQCGKFVIDDEAGTIRLPKITGFIQGLTDLASLGELVQAGLPTLTTDSTGAHTHTRGTMDIKGEYYGIYDNQPLGAESGAHYSGAFYKARAAGSRYASSTADGVGGSLGFQASKNWTGATSSNGAHTHTIAGTSDTVQPEAIRYPYFIQVATGVEETIDTTREIELNNPFFFGYYQYFEIAPNNTSWLKSEAQWNNKEVYPDYYDWVLTNANNGVANFKLSTDTYDDYSWVVNIADETFRLPLKTKNAPFTVSGAKTTLSMGALSIKGNGKALGLTDGSLTASPVASKNYAAGSVFQKSAYNTNVGTVISSPSDSNGLGSTNKSIGVTTDASKSGLTGSVSGTATTTVSTSENTNVSLYFYVGETTQNANLVNVGRIEESLAKKLDISTVRYESSTSTLFIGVL